MGLLSIKTILLLGVMLCWGAFCSVHCLKLTWDSAMGDLRWPCSNDCQGCDLCALEGCGHWCSLISKSIWQENLVLTWGQQQSPMVKGNIFQVQISLFTVLLGIKGWYRMVKLTLPVNTSKHVLLSSTWPNTKRVRTHIYREIQHSTNAHNKSRWWPVESWDQITDAHCWPRKSTSGRMRFYLAK